MYGGVTSENDLISLLAAHLMRVPRETRHALSTQLAALALAPDSKDLADSLRDTMDLSGTSRKQRVA